MANLTSLEAMTANRDSRLTQARHFAIAVAATFLILYHLYVGLLGSPPGYVFKAVHLGAAQLLVFLIFPLAKKRGPRFTLLDLAGALATLFITTYMLWFHEDWHLKIAGLGAFDFIVGCVMILLVWEGTRRTIGWPMIIVSVLFFINAVFTDKFVGIFSGTPHSWNYVITVLFVEEEGIFGIPISVMATYVILFLVFAALLLNTGAGQFFTKFAFGMFGHKVGGPAKAAVVSSALMGTLSGSAIGNVVTTGSFTIPLMKRMGYSAPFAAGVEATASTGGQFMPPIMGAVAFIMAEFMGVPYLKIALAATIPAILYFSGVFTVVHFRAVKEGIGVVPRRYLPDVKAILLKNGYLAFPLVLIIVILALGYSIVFVAMAAIATTFALSFIRRATRLSPRALMAALERSIRTAVPLSMTCACAGIIIGSVYITGLSWRLSYSIVDVAGGQLWLVLLFTMILAIVLGMGLTTSAVYITLVAIIIPVLVEMGVEPMAAHLFALYFGILSCITPPVALASYAAAGVADTSPMKAGWEASKIGLIGFFVPFLFVYAPELLLIGSPFGIALHFCTAFIGCLTIAAVVEGWLVGRANLFQRGLLLASALLMMSPGLTTDIPGLALLVGVFLWQKKVQARPGRRQDGTADAGAGQEADAEAAEVDPELLKFLQEDEGEGGRNGTDRADKPWKDYLLWGVLCAAFASFFVMGKYNLQVLYVRAWVGCLLAISLIIVAAFWFCFSKAGSAVQGEKK